VPVVLGLRRTIEWYLEDPEGRGTAVEPQLQDGFRYDLEDLLLEALDRTQSDIEAIDFPEFDMAHPYAHPKAEASKA